VQITVIGYEEEHEHSVLVYTVEVADPRAARDHDAVQAAIQAERNRDLGCEANPMVILFAFAGDLPILADWRE
jgi:hypothetical protein